MGGIKLMVEITTIDEFNYFTGQDEYVLVDFYAKWCGKCKQLSGRLMVDYADKVDIYKVDIDSFPALAAEFDVTELPKLVLFQNGEVVAEQKKSAMIFLKNLEHFLKEKDRL